MNVKFKDLKIGDQFYISGSEYIKIDDRIYGGRLSSRPSNAINLSNSHRVVIGLEVPVNIKTEVINE